MPMRPVGWLAWIASAGALVLVLCRCTPGGQFDPTEVLSTDIFDSKKKLQGEREPLFPEGVPGAQNGVPPDLIKGYQPPPEQAADNAEAETKPAAPSPKPKPKPKPKPAMARAAAPPQKQQPAQSPWPVAPQAAPAQTNWPPPPQTGPAQTNWPPPPPTGQAQQGAPVQTNWPPPGQGQQAAQPAQTVGPNPGAPASSH